MHDEVGADALALIIQSGIRDSAETAIAIDYGTNAEMALLHQGSFYTGSASAGPGAGRPAHQLRQPGNPGGHL